MADHHVIAMVSVRFGLSHFIDTNTAWPPGL